MRVIVTGASGTVGTALVPLLMQRGFEVLLVGRDSAKMQVLFPRTAVCTYEELADRANGFEALLNLAVINSDSQVSEEEFNDVNAELSLRLAELATAAGVRRFIYVSSLHALDPSRNTFYARSKRLGLEKLKSVRALDIRTVYLPAVRGANWAGRWSFLNAIPGWFRKLIVSVLTALRPVVDIETLSEKLAVVLNSEDAPQESVISNGQSANPFYHVARRSMDIAASLTIFILLWWLLVAIWTLIRTKSDGPGLFAQQRVGQYGRPFVCYKFRTMHTGTREAATHEITTSSVTNIGKFLRRTKLDELPQAWNLLKGEMTLVGPRPCLPSQKELVQERLRAGVLELAPGITGLAQVNDVDMSIPKVLVVYDQRYLGMQSLILDLRLLISTITGKGSGDRVSE